MNLHKLLNPPSLFLEINSSALLAFDGNAGLEAPLERLENGRLTPSCRGQLIRSLQAFLQKNYWQVRPKAICAISARGVSLRRFILPTSSRDEFHRLLVLQIERELPLSPDELAWGWLPLQSGRASREPGTAGQEILVVAVKKEVVEEYSEILTQCGLNPVFTLGAWARKELCPHSAGPYAILDIGAHQSELAIFHQGAPESIRILPWGESDIIGWMRSASSQDEGNISRDLMDQSSQAMVELASVNSNVLPPGLEVLPEMFPQHTQSRPLFLTGQFSGLGDLAPKLSRGLQGTVQCEPIMIPSGLGRSAAILGMQNSAAQNGALPELILHARKAQRGEQALRPIPWRWLVLALVLFLAALGSRYAEAFLMKPSLQRKLAEIKTFRSQIPQIEQEWSFLNYIKTNQPPCLDAFWVIANSVPPGVRLENLTMTRRGDLSMRLTLGPPQQQQSSEFRSKLLDSGFFSSVVIEEQTPTPDKQKVNVRLSAQWKPFGTREMRVSTPSRPAPGSAGPPSVPMSISGPASGPPAATSAGPASAAPVRRDASRIPPSAKSP